MKLYCEERQGTTKQNLILDKMFKVNGGSRNRLPAIDEDLKKKRKKNPEVTEIEILC